MDVPAFQFFFYSIQMDFFDTVGGIKERIEQLFGIPVYMQNIILKNFVLCDDFIITPNDDIILKTAHFPIMAEDPAPVAAPSHFSDQVPPKPESTRLFPFGDLEHYGAEAPPVPTPQLPVLPDQVLPPIPQPTGLFSSDDLENFVGQAPTVPTPQLPALPDQVLPPMLEPTGFFPSDYLQSNVAGAAGPSSAHIDLVMAPELGTYFSSQEIRLIHRATVLSSSNYVPPASPQTLLLMVNIPTPSRHSVIVEIHRHDTVLSLKNMILAVDHVNLQAIRNPLVLRFNGQEFEDSRSLTECRVSEATVIDVWFRPLNYNTMVVLLLSHCKTKSIPVEVNSDDRIGELRNVLQRLINLLQRLDFPLPPTDDYFFMYMGRLMPEEKIFMEEFKDGDTIEIFAGKELVAKRRRKERSQELRRKERRVEIKDKPVRG